MDTLSGRHRIGAALWVASLIVFPVQVVTALRWPDGYSWTRNAISDLGVTTCGRFSEQGDQVREVCSPAHQLFNLGMVVTGALVLVGAILLIGHWRTRAGWCAAVLTAISGLLVIVVGLAPWDTRPDLHDTAALGQAVAQWVAMALLAVAAGPGILRRISVVALVVSVAGFAGFLVALEGTDIPLVGFGGSERLAFDTLSLWIVLVGALVLSGRSGPVTTAPD